MKLLPVLARSRQKKIYENINSHCYESSIGEIKEIGIQHIKIVFFGIVPTSATIQAYSGKKILTNHEAWYKDGQEFHGMNLLKLQVNFANNYSISDFFSIGYSHCM